MKIFYLYLILINAIGYGIMHTDKQKAIKGAWRIPESALMTVAILGGSVGSLLGMYRFHHKTKHPKFKFGIPLILFLQIGLILLLLRSSLLS